MQVIELDKYASDQSEVKDWNMELPVASAIRGHLRDFLNSIDDRSKPVADIEQGHISSASCIMANNAMQLGRTLAFDPETHTIPGDDEATTALKRPYREPYKHPGSTS